jgi:adenine-specific DNA-methyltransferase
MMMPRLYLAKNLLRQDGVIFVSIDDNEVHNLRLLMNEIFGEENFVSEIVWERSYAPINMVKHFSKSHDYVLCYAKNLDLLECFGLQRPESTNAKYGNPDNDPRGLWRTDNLSVGPVVESKVYEIITSSGRKCLPPKGRCWLYTRERYEEMIADNRIWFGENGNNIPAPKRFLSEVKQGLTPLTIWKYADVGHNQESMRELRDIFDGEKVFDYSKPVKLIKQIVQLYSSENEVILDFFAGSGTTAHAVMDLNATDGGNRKHICVQLPELTDEKSEAYKTGYRTIAEISKERIRRAGKKIQEEIKKEIKNLELLITKLQGELPTEENKTEIENLKSKIEQLKTQDLGFKVLKLEDSNFKQWHQIEGKDAKALAEQMKLFVDPVSESATIENMVYELLLKSGKDLNSSIEKNDGYFLINGNEMALILEKVSQKIITEVMSECPKKVIALDKLFKGNDQLKTNTILQMKDAGIEFKTI